MDKAKEISALWSQIKPQIGKLVSLCHEVESHYEVTADAYQRGYEAGLNDAKEGKASCQFCEYEVCSDRVDPCRVCACNYKNFFEPKKQEKEEQIQVGDEVIYDGKRCVVVFPKTEHLYATVIDCGCFHHTHVVDYDGLTKTGRHFPELVEALRKMREE